jgi:hypothetical protein
VPPSLRRSGAGVLLVLGVTLAGCGSGEAEPTGRGTDGSDPVAWVGAFCGGIGEVLGKADTLRDAPDAQAQKQALLSYIDGTAQALRATGDRLTELGPPKIADGRRVHDAAVKVVDSVADAVVGPRAQLEALDPSAPDFAEKMAQIPGPDLSPVAAQVQALQGNAELAEARAAAPECQQLGAAATG